MCIKIMVDLLNLPDSLICSATMTGTTASEVFIMSQATAILPSESEPTFSYIDQKTIVTQLVRIAKLLQMLVVIKNKNLINRNTAYISGYNFCW